MLIIEISIFNLTANLYLNLLIKGSFVFADAPSSFSIGEARMRTSLLASILVGATLLCWATVCLSSSFQSASSQWWTEQRGCRCFACETSFATSEQLALALHYLASLVSFAASLYDLGAKVNSFWLLPWLVSSPDSTFLGQIRALLPSGCHKQHSCDHLYGFRPRCHDYDPLPLFTD